MTLPKHRRFVCVYLADCINNAMHTNLAFIVNVTATALAARDQALN